jgi:hypothetical protein
MRLQIHESFIVRVFQGNGEVGWRQCAGAALGPFHQQDGAFIE